MEQVNHKYSKNKLSSQCHLEQPTKSFVQQSLTKTTYKKSKKSNQEEIADAEEEIINLKDNFLPTGLTPLEDIFDSNDIPRKPKYAASKCCH